MPNIEERLAAQVKTSYDLSYFDRFDVTMTSPPSVKIYISGIRLHNFPRSTERVAIYLSKDRRRIAFVPDDPQGYPLLPGGRNQGKIKCCCSLVLNEILRAGIELPQECTCEHFDDGVYIATLKTAAQSSYTPASDKKGGKK